MDKKKLADLGLTGGIVILGAAVVVRVANLILVGLDMPFALNIQGLWKLSVGLLLVSIAASLNKS